MKVLRAAVLSIALAAALAGIPVHADDPALSVRLTLGWDGVAASGSWIPYAVSIRNDSSSADFKGSVVVRAQPPPGAGGPVSGYGPSYQQAISVPHAAQKEVTIYGAYLDSSGSSAGYFAELVGPGGTVIARSPVAGLSSGRLAVGLLSDSLQVAGQIRDVAFGTGSSGVVRLTPASLPASALELSGLAALVIDEFDTSTLSQAQGQAVEQYVGLGGRLLLAGGSGWRRTFAQLPAELVPMAPQASVAVSLDRVLDLAARHSATTATGVVGTVARGARVVLADASGNPLLVELGYGAGQVLEVVYDPAEQPVVDHPDDVRATWSAILHRLAPVVTVSRQNAAAVVLAPAIGSGQQGVTRAGLDQALSSLLNDTPANALPPLGLLGGLLVLYLLLAGPLNYAVLRRVRRRELMWVTVPLLSVLFTTASYGAGVLVHGRDYFVNEIQVLRVTPAGAIDAASYDAVFAPGRGDLSIQLGEATLASTYLPTQSSLADGGDDRVINAATTLVNLRNIAIWTPRDFKTEAATRVPIVVESHLRMSAGRITGTLANRSRATLRRVQLMTTDNRVAVLAAMIRPGAMVTVGAPLRALQAAATGPSRTCNASGCLDTAAGGSSPTEREASVMADAAGAVLSPATQVQALTGVVDPVPGFLVNGAEPTRSVIAAFVLPLGLEAVDTLPAAWSAPRVVADNGLAGDPVSVIDYQLPPMEPAAVSLQLKSGGASALGSATSVAVPPPTVEIYDWTAARWEPADLNHAFLLSPGERGPDLVRLRVRGGLFLQGLQVSTP